MRKQKKHVGLGEPIYRLIQLSCTLALLSALPHTVAADETSLLALWDGGKWGYITPSGDIRIRPQFERVYGDFSEGLAAVEVDKKYAFIDTSGKIVIQPRFVSVNNFSEGLAAVAIGESFENKRYGYIDKTGRFVIKSRFTFAHSFSDGLARVWSKGDKPEDGYINAKGELVINLTGRRAYSESYNVHLADAGGDFKEGQAVVCLKTEQGPRYGVMDRSGKITVQATFVHAGDFSDGFAPVVITPPTEMQPGAGGWIDRSGTLVIKIGISPSTRLGRFAEGLAAFETDGKWGFLDKTGKTVIPPRFIQKYGHPFFSEGLAPVTTNNLWGYIATSGEWAIPPRFDEVQPFEHGVAEVWINRNKGIIDSTGAYVFSPVGGFQYEGGDGLSPGKAIIIRCADSHREGVSAEYHWLRRHYPGYSMERQSLRTIDGVAHDVIEIKTATEEKKEIFFNIADFIDKD